MVCINDNGISFLEKYDKTSNGFSKAELDNAFRDVFREKYVPSTEEQRIALSRAISAARYLVQLTPNKTLKANFFRDLKNKCLQEPVSVAGLSLGDVRVEGESATVMAEARFLDPNASGDTYLTSGVSSSLSLSVSIRGDGEAEPQTTTYASLAFDNADLCQRIKVPRGSGFAVSLEVKYDGRTIRTGTFQYNAEGRAQAVEETKVAANL